MKFCVIDETATVRCLALVWWKALTKEGKGDFRRLRSDLAPKFSPPSLSYSCYTARLALASLSRETHVKPNTRASEAYHMISTRDVPVSIFL